MKKILVLTVLIVILIGNAYASGDKETSDEGPLDGIWVREDGAYFTFSGKNWEMVDMTNGAAGYGTFKLRGENYIDFVVTDCQNLAAPVVSEYNTTIKKNGRRDGTNAVIKDFQTRAHEEYNTLYPERILQRIIMTYPGKKVISWCQVDPETDTIISSDGWFAFNGNWPQEINVDENTFTLTEYRAPDGIKRFYTDSFSGTFVRQ